MKNTLIILFLCITFSGISQDLDSLKKQINLTEDKKEKTELLFEICKIYMRTNYDSSFRYAQKTLDHAVKNNDAKMQGSALKKIGILYFYQGDYTKADSLLTRSSEIFIKIKDTINYALNLSAVGDLYKARGESQKAIKVYIRAQAIMKILEDKNNEALVLNKIAGLYYALKQYDKAIQYYHSALDIVSKDNFIPAISALYINIGNVYSDMYIEEKDPNIKLHYLETAENYYQKALPLKRQINDLKGLATCLINLGLNHTRKHENETAIENFNEAIEISKKINNSDNLFRAYQNLANIYVNIGEYKKALIFAEYVYNAKKNEGFEPDIQMKLKNHFILAKIYENLNFPKKALQHYTEYSSVKDSIYNTEKLKIISELDAEYQTTIKDQENKLLQNENDIQKLQLQKNRTQLFVLTTVSAGAILSIIIFLLIIRQRKLRNEQKTIKLEQRLLRSQMNPHFIFNSLVAVQSFILKSKPEEGAKYLSKFASLIRLVLEHSRTDYVSVEKETEALKHYLELQKLRYENRFDYEIYRDQNIQPDNYFIPPMLAQPFIENAIEHGIAPSEKKGFIEIHFKKKDSKYFEFMVKDNGIGFKYDKENRSHISLATKITTERLKLLNRNKKQKIKLEIIERKNSKNEIEGVTTLFLIPFIIKF